MFGGRIIRTAIKITVNCSNASDKLDARELWEEHYRANKYDFMNLLLTKAQPIRDVSPLSFYVIGFEVWGPDPEQFILFLYENKFPFTTVKIEFAGPDYPDTNYGTIVFTPYQHRTFNINSNGFDFWEPYNAWIQSTKLPLFKQMKSITFSIMVSSISQSIATSLESANILLANDEKHIPMEIASYVVGTYSEPIEATTSKYIELFNENHSLEVEYLQHKQVSQSIIGLWKLYYDII